MSETPRQIGTAALTGLAHPLRVRIFDELSAKGPATSSELARRFGETSGATSYHLRQLARHGFIHELPDRGTAKERWWRAAPDSMRLEGDDISRTGPPAAREAVQLVVQEWNRGRSERLAHWLATTTTWPRGWVRGSFDGTGHFRLRQEEMARMSAELQAVLDRWAEEVGHRKEEEPADDTYDVEVQLAVFPLEPPRRHDGLGSEPPAPPGPPTGPSVQPPSAAPTIPPSLPPGPPSGP